MHKRVITWGVKVTNKYVSPDRLSCSKLKSHLHSQDMRMIWTKKWNHINKIKKEERKKWITKKTKMKKKTRTKTAWNAMCSQSTMRQNEDNTCERSWNNRYSQTWYCGNCSSCSSFCQLELNNVSLRVETQDSTVIYGYRIKYICRIGMWDSGHKMNTFYDFIQMISFFEINPALIHWNNINNILCMFAFF